MYTIKIYVFPVSVSSNDTMPHLWEARRRKTARDTTCNSNIFLLPVAIHLAESCSFGKPWATENITVKAFCYLLFVIFFSLFVDIYMIFFAQQYTHQAPHQIYFTEYKESGLECKWAKAKMCGVFFCHLETETLFLLLLLLLLLETMIIILFCVKWAPFYFSFWMIRLNAKTLNKFLGFCDWKMFNFKATM